MGTPTKNEIRQYEMLGNAALVKHRLAMSMPMSEWPKPDEISAKAKLYARNPEGAFDTAFTNSKLGAALKKKYKTQEAALRALGINPSVLRDDVVGDKAMRRMGRDEDPPRQKSVSTEAMDDEDNEGALHRFLESRMNPEDLERCKELLAAVMGEEGEDEELDQQDPREIRQRDVDAEDDSLGEPYHETNGPGPKQFGGPPNFRGMPERGGRKADLGEDSYSAAISNSERIGLDPWDHGIDRYGQTRRSPAVAFDSSSDETSYNEMFPDAARIGIR